MSPQSPSWCPSRELRLWDELTKGLEGGTEHPGVAQSTHGCPWG